MQRVYESYLGADADMHILLTGFTSRLNTEEVKFYSQTNRAKILFTYDNVHHPYATYLNRGTFQPVFLHKFSKTVYSDEECLDLIQSIVTQENPASGHVGAVCFDTRGTHITNHQIIADLNRDEFRYCEYMPPSSLTHFASYTDPKWGRVFVTGVDNRM